MSSMKKETWKKVVGWCPLCWWKYHAEFDLTAEPEAIEARMKQLHEQESPKCHEKIRIEGK